MGLKRVPGTILPIDDYCYIEGMPHLNMAAMRAMPDNSYCLAHVPASYDLAGFRVITIMREPRDCLVSYCRHRKRDGYDYSIPQALKDFWGSPFIPAYRGYLGWAGRAVVLRYEALPAHVIGRGSGIYRGHQKDWNTRTGQPSDWRKVWDDEAEAAWLEHGGPELLAEAGYEAHC